ncbi:MAG: AAA family ATPase [Phycisphaerae bacterium]|jgi:hypothetical protein
MGDPLDVFAPTQDSDSLLPAATASDAPAFRPTVIRRRLSDVTPEDVSWLWPGRFPYGKLSLIVGDPGLGKSFLTLDIAARLSCGTPWPDLRDARIETTNTVILSAEDDPADTIRPRLDAAEADVTRIHVVEAVQRNEDGDRAYFNLDLDLKPLEDCIVATNARLVVIDPVSAYLGDRDSHSNADIRGLLAPLSDLAARRRCAVVAVTHMNKSGASRALYRAMGSLAFTAAARIAWLVAKDNDNPARRLLLPIKSNLIEDPSGIAFEIADGRVCWFPERIDLDADSVLAVSTEDRTECAEAADWLTELLAVGPMPVNEIQQAAKADCHAWRTVERAKKLLKIRSSREGFGSGSRYVWQLPSEAD